MLDLLSLKLAGNEIRDVRPVIQLAQWITVDIKTKNCFRRWTNESRNPNSYLRFRGEIFEDIELKSTDGIVTDRGTVVWKTPEQNLFILLKWELSRSVSIIQWYSYSKYSSERRTKRTSGRS